MRSLVVVVVALAACKSSDNAPPNASEPKQANGSSVNAPDPFQGPDAGAGHAILVDENGDLTATADVDKDSVRKVVKANVSKLQLCYEQALLANPGIEGKIVVTFTIGIEGAVGDVSANGIHPDVETCVAEKFRTFKFPKPSVNKVEVQYPFTFRPA
jgi:hypothetical protein